MWLYVYLATVWINTMLWKCIDQRNWNHGSTSKKCLIWLRTLLQIVILKGMIWRFYLKSWMCDVWVVSVKQPTGFDFKPATCRWCIFKAATCPACGNAYLQEPQCSARISQRLWTLTIKAWKGSSPETNAEAKQHCHWWQEILDGQPWEYPWISDGTLQNLCSDLM